MEMYCNISLQPVSETDSKYPDYLDAEFIRLFSDLRVDPVLPFKRQDFFRQGVVKSKGLSISGVQEKLSLKINSDHQLEITDKDGEYILKPSPEAFPHAAENEHCAMQTSRLVGIETALCGLVRFSDGEPAYITRRFDRTADGRIHQEDLAQGFGMDSRDKYAHSYEKAGHLIRLMTRDDERAVLDFFLRILHAYLIGNDDMHLKNISLQKLPHNRGLYYDRLTPHYDCLFTQAFGFPAAPGFLALDLLEDEKNGVFSKAFQTYGFYTGHDFRILGRRLGVAEPNISGSIQSLILKTPAIVELIRRSVMPDDMKQQAGDMVIQRARALEME